MYYFLLLATNCAQFYPLWHTWTHTEVYRSDALLSSLRHFSYCLFYFSFSSSSFFFQLFLIFYLVFIHACILLLPRKLKGLLLSFMRECEFAYCYPVSNVVFSYLLQNVEEGIYTVSFWSKRHTQQLTVEVLNDNLSCQQILLINWTKFLIFSLSVLLSGVDSSRPGHIWNYRWKEVTWWLKVQDKFFF